MFVLTSVENTYLTPCELDPGVPLPSLQCLCHMTRFSSWASHPSSQDWGQGWGHSQDSPPGSCYGKLCGRCIGKAAVNGHGRPAKNVWSSRASLSCWASEPSQRGQETAWGCPHGHPPSTSHTLLNHAIDRSLWHWDFKYLDLLCMELSKPF